MAKKYDMPFFETSAKEDINIQEVFKNMAIDLLTNVNLKFIIMLNVHLIQIKLNF